MSATLSLSPDPCACAEGYGGLLRCWCGVSVCTIAYLLLRGRQTSDLLLLEEIGLGSSPRFGFPSRCSPSAQSQSIPLYSTHAYLRTSPLPVPAPPPPPERPVGASQPPTS
eukprot:scaffold17198_cov119-Isochrysis_galbana.AAC.4